jgi:hypothetical protein
LITQKTTYPAIDHIIVNNIEIAFGTDVNNMKDNELKIYSPDSLEYNYYTPTSETN